MKKIRLPYMEPKTTANEIGDFVLERVLSAGASGCAIGLSGGVDSTASAAIIKRAFDAHNKSGVPDLELVGYILPSGTNGHADTEDGKIVAERLGIRYEIHNIEPLVTAHELTNPEALSDKYHRGNLTSRIRANILSTKAATEGKLLAGTGNRDEDYGIGYYTLFGDGAVHFSPIGGLSKRLVREMASYLGFDDLAHRTPTAGLEPGQTDFKDLGYEYNLVELVIEGIDQGIPPKDLAVHPQIVPEFERQQESYAQSFGMPKYQDTDEMISDILRRHTIAEAKVRIVSPPVAPVTLRYG